MTKQLNILVLIPFIGIIATLLLSDTITLDQGIGRVHKLLNYHFTLIFLAIIYFNIFH